MKLILYIIRHFIPIGLIAGAGVLVFSAATPAESTRVEGFGSRCQPCPP